MIILDDSSKGSCSKVASKASDRISNQGDGSNFIGAFMERQQITNGYVNCTAKKTMATFAKKNSVQDHVMPQGSSTNILHEEQVNEHILMAPLSVGRQDKNKFQWRRLSENHQDLLKQGFQRHSSVKSLNMNFPGS